MVAGWPEDAAAWPKPREEAGAGGCELAGAEDWIWEAGAPGAAANIDGLLSVLVGCGALDSAGFAPAPKSPDPELAGADVDAANIDVGFLS